MLRRALIFTALLVGAECHSVPASASAGEEQLGANCAASGSCVSADTVDFLQMNLKAHRAVDVGRSGAKGSRVVVVNNFNHAKDLSWIQGMEVESVGFTGPRIWSESRPWLLWIWENYDELPDIVVFLHGDKTSWHAHVDLKYIKNTVPTNITMLADRNCNWKNNLPSTLVGELPGLNALYRALFKKGFADAFEDFHMAHNYVCCSENIVTRKTLMRFSKDVYRSMIALIDRKPDLPWGWIFERTWQNMWSQPLGIANRSIIDSLDSALNHDAASLLQASKMEAEALARVLKAASSCADGR